MYGGHLSRDRILHATDPFSRKSTIFVDVKSKSLHDLLREVLEKVKAVSVLEPKPAIEKIVLFHFLPELKSKLDQLTHCEQSTDTADPRNPPRGIEHLRLLVDYIEKAYAPTMERLTPLLQRGEITYDLLEFLFKPGCHVYTKCPGTGKSRCVVYNAAEEITRADGTHLRLDCYYLDHDDHKIGEVEIELGIVKFRGRKPIHTLEAFPLQHHPDCEQITQDLQKCGRKFSQFIRRCKEDILMQHCKGTAFIMKNGKPLASNINSLVAINPALFYEIMPKYYCPRVSNCWDQHLITEDECLICCPTVQCFVFNEKRFLECAVSDLTEVQWSPASFDRLQIPDDKKEIILRVTDARLSGNRDVDFDDFIKGKGRGLNILFYGEPGVGKTFTIQAMAERSQRPLYSVSAGELIADHGGPLQLEKALDQIFKIAKGTGSILLFDEADVFMEKRATYQGGQNKLVTIFLRGLESYEGVLFLTTNRVKEFDDAVISRIHLKIQYTKLTQDARRNIWESFLLVAGTPQGPAILETSELEHLIKNIWCVAQAIAVAENSQVTFKHLETAIKANDEFVEEFMNSGRMQGMYT
ncbi:hypothetical protein ASPCAL15108 [Aspergillus calidoustus]|uniref:AAA+ ATPase domain-containing protein n=1 Tax=Aspergillus calidoustus TaxID=454130 RepID=A0A0U5GPQ2_ASPCI|nr:hypothetical protein ASPCAL15108 [Aspergillus calidoustus]